jgi:cold shock CspA family protein
MAKSQETFSKKEKEKKRLKKRQDKEQKKEERKANAKDSSFDNMIAYVDENGNLTDTPPNPLKKKVVDVNSIEIGVSKREDIEVDAVKKGRVEFFNDSKGFGFIKELDSNEKYFVHINGLIDKIKENDMVTFELERTARGMNAIGVKKV